MPRPFGQNHGEQGPDDGRLDVEGLLRRVAAANRADALTEGLSAQEGALRAAGELGLSQEEVKAVLDRRSGQSADAAAEPDGGSVGHMVTRLGLNGPEHEHQEGQPDRRALGATE